MQQSIFGVIGKTAKTGVRVEQRLQALGYKTQGVSRSTTPVFDWQQPDTWRPALHGTTSAYVTFYPDLAVPDAEQSIRHFIEAARDEGLRHLVLLSGRGEQGAQRAEALLQSSGLDWNIVRANWFMQNFSEGFMVQGILNGELALPAGDTVEPFVDLDDVADVAVAALTNPDLLNRVLEVSGPRALSFRDAVAEISAAVGYDVSYTQISVEEFLDASRRDGAPDDVLWLMNELFSVVFDGRNSQPAYGVKEALGRPATDFSAYVAKVVKQGTWTRQGLLQQA